MKVDWFAIWHEDREAIIATMARNLAADLIAGYDYFGDCVQRQIREINAAKKTFQAELEKIACMDEKKVNHWCYIQLVKHGAVSVG